MTNTLHQGDNLEILKTIPDEFVDLIYLDPPFNTGRNFDDFKDKWNLKEYLDFIKLRIKECHRVLKQTGSIYLHCDWRTNHHFRFLLDEVFGEKNFLNEIIWQCIKANNSSKNSFPKSHNSIFLFKKGKINKYIQLFNKKDPSYLRKCFKYEKINPETNKMEKYQSQPLGSHKGNGYFYDFLGFKTPKNGYNTSKERMAVLQKKGLLHFPKNKKGVLRQVWFESRYKGSKINSLWNDINPVGSPDRYSTQKPLALLDRIIKASSNEGDLVLDPFCGSGTTCVSAKNLKRNYIGIDLNPKAIEITNKRLDE